MKNNHPPQSKWVWSNLLRAWTEQKNGRRANSLWVQTSIFACPQKRKLVLLVRWLSYSDWYLHHQLPSTLFLSPFFSNWVTPLAFGSPACRAQIVWPLSSINLSVGSYNISVCVCVCVSNIYTWLMLFHKLKSILSSNFLTGYLMTSSIPGSHSKSILHLNIPFS